MADFLNTSLTGLLANQNALATTSHNIANVNTEGYNRQRIVFGTLPASNVGVGFVGRGVQVESISRVVDGFRTSQLRDSVSEQSRLEALYQMSSGIDTLLASPNTGLSGPLNNFYASMQKLADDPSSLAARQAVMSEASILVDRFQTLNGRLDTLAGDVETQLDINIEEVNLLTGAIADVNLAIQSASVGGQPNDLLDQRDLLLKDLASKLSVTVVDDGAMVNVFAANGQALVLGAQPSSLSLIPGEYAGTGSQIGLSGPGVSGVQPLDDLSGGTVGGLLDFRREVLDPIRNGLGQLATALTSSVNGQHRLGMDLDGALGGDFFAIDAPLVLTGRSNAGTGVVTVSIGDPGALTTGDYVLGYDGAAYSLRRLDTGAVVPLSGSGTALDPFVADGLSIVVNPPPAAGDTFLIRPTVAAASGLGLAVDDIRHLAAAMPVISSADLTNTGNGTIFGDNVVDISHPDLLDPVTIAFTDPNTYTINGAGSFAYVPGQTIAVNGWEVVLDGAPEAGDVFNVNSNVGGVGDNRNALALFDSGTRGILNGGTLSVQSGFENLVAATGAATRQAEINLTAQSSITEQITAEQLATSGVNLDEEAANMLRYQQAYQAIAQLIGVADVLFQTVLAASSR